MMSERLHAALTFLSCASQHVRSTLGRWPGHMRAYGTDAHAHPISPASYEQHVKEAQEWKRAYRPFYSRGEVPPTWLGSAPASIRQAISPQAALWKVCMPWQLSVERRALANCVTAQTKPLQRADAKLLGVTELDDELKALMRASAEGPSRGGSREERRKKKRRADPEGPDEDASRRRRHRTLQVMCTWCS